MGGNIGRRSAEDAADEEDVTARVSRVGLKLPGTSRAEGGYQNGGESASGAAEGRPRQKHSTGRGVSQGHSGQVATARVKQGLPP